MYVFVIIPFMLRLGQVSASRSGGPSVCRGSERAYHFGHIGMIGLSSSSTLRHEVVGDRGINAELSPLGVDEYELQLIHSMLLVQK